TAELVHRTGKLVHLSLDVRRKSVVRGSVGLFALLPVVLRVVHGDEVAPVRHRVEAHRVEVRDVNVVSRRSQRLRRLACHRAVEALRFRVGMNDKDPHRVPLIPTVLCGVSLLNQPPTFDVSGKRDRTRRSTDPSCASSALSPLSTRGDLVAVAAFRHVAPPTVVRPGAVIKPKNTLLILTASYETKVTAGEQLGGTFSYGYEDLLRSARIPASPEVQASVAPRYQLQITPSFREENIEGPRIDPLSCFSFLYESANCLAQCARVFEQGGLPKMCETILNRPAGAPEPLQDVAVAL